MNKSEQINELAKALAAAQGMMGPAIKDKANPFFKSVYADLASVINAVRLPLSSNGLSYVQVMEPSEHDEVRVETVLMHESGQWVSSLTCIPVSKSDAQGYGSATTYAKRYGLQSLLGVPSEDDDGNAAAAATAKKKGTPAIQQAPINPSTGVWESMDEGQQKALEEIAANVIALLGENRAKEALEYIGKQDLSAEERVALNTRFDSKQRRAMKDARTITPEDYANTV